MPFEELCKNCPTNFVTYMHYCRNLDFEQEPNYDYLLDLISSIAQERQIDLHDNVFDWNIRAVCIKNHPGFFDFTASSRHSPFTDTGRFQIHLVPPHKLEEEKLIYREARQYRFEDTRQLVKL